MALAPVPAHPRRLVFLGTPAIAVAPLEALVQRGFDVALVVTRADKRRGRGSALLPSPVKEAAVALGLAVTHRVDDVLAAGADLGVVVAYGQLIKAHVLEALPMVNLHFSLLPRWRGAAPVERALLAGDDETGVCLMQLEEGLDTGPVFGCERVPITTRTTAAALRAELVRVGTDLLVGEPRGRARRPSAPDRRAHVRGQGRARRAGDRLVPTGRGARPPGPPGRGLDDAARPALEGPRRRGRSRAGRAPSRRLRRRRVSWRPVPSPETGSAPVAGRWCSARCSQKAGRRWP